MSYTNGLDDPSAYFQTVLYVGNATARSITFDGNTDMQPDWCWFKNRTDAGNNHLLYDSVRGATKRIQSSTTSAEATDSDGLTSFDSDGFSIGSKGSLNNSSSNIVAWNWKESATAGFDIVSYTGNSSDGVTQQNISHSLSAVPQVIIIKNRADATNWCVYHHKNTSAPETEIIYLNLTNATSDDSAFFGDTSPTSSIFTVGGDNGVNGNGDSMIAYCFAEKKGFSKFGSYTGNGNADGTFVYTGFKPAFLMVKRTDSVNNWVIYDNKRPNSFNEITHVLLANGADAEQTSTSDDDLDFVSNGVKMRCSNNGSNGSGASYIYMAFAKNPFVTSTGIPTTAR